MGKIGIIGAGSVGATIAYAALIRGMAREISLFDIVRTKVDAEVLDLNHGLLFVPPAKVDGSDDAEVLRGADVVVMTAGAKQKPGQTRMDLAEANAEICRKILPEVVRIGTAMSRCRMCTLTLRASMATRRFRCGRARRSVRFP